MTRFEEEDDEPVAVVRTLSDFALALTLVVLMLIGTHSAAESKNAAETRAAQTGGTKAELNLQLVEGSRFTMGSEGAANAARSAAAIAGPWIAAHPNASATIVVQFPPKTLATELHRALLDLQAAFGTNLSRIDTIPQL